MVAIVVSWRAVGGSSGGIFGIGWAEFIIFGATCFTFLLPVIVFLIVRARNNRHSSPQERSTGPTAKGFAGSFCRLLWLFTIVVFVLLALRLTIFAVQHGGLTPEDLFPLATPVMMGTIATAVWLFTERRKRRRESDSDSSATPDSNTLEWGMQLLR